MFISFNSQRAPPPPSLGPRLDCGLHGFYLFTGTPERHHPSSSALPSSGFSVYGTSCRSQLTPRLQCPAWWRLPELHPAVTPPPAPGSHPYIHSGLLQNLTAIYPRPLKYIFPSKPITSALIKLSFPRCSFSMREPSGITTSNPTSVFKIEIDQRK